MGKFKITKNKRPATKAQLKQYLSKPAFGVQFTDHMAHIHYENKKWSKFEVIPFQNLSLSPACCSLHYAQEVFEGVKAYKWKDGSVRVFRPEANGERLQKSSMRICLPILPVNDFVEAIKEVVKIDKQWVPGEEGQSLYIRPFIIGTDPYIGIRVPEVADFYVILSPVGSYLKTDAGNKIWVETKYFRSGPGGTGAAKCGGNYAASLVAKKNAATHGCADSLFLDAKEVKYVEEFSGMSFFAVTKDGQLITPKINERILDSITRNSLIQIAKDNKIKVTEKDIDFKKEIIAGLKSKNIVEIFACGTAAVVSPVSELNGDDFSIVVGDGKPGKISMFLKQQLVGIQKGEVLDTHNWMVKII
ncbi:MAG: branched-chain amino acid aminotransferase [Mycoplasmoidaceae bacterium]|nr:MAG: branched-chain amino acid aminotransferase [Mycoplasmoidaceae bacterium]